MEKWVQENLSKILNFQIPDDLAQCIVQLENERDLEDYLVSLLGNENPKHRQFITDLKKQRASYNQQTRYKKTNNNDQISIKQNDKKKAKTKGKENVQDIAKEKIEKIEKIEKKKPKYVNLYSQKGDVMLKGRHKCNCEARRHALINNCFHCGRIVCEQEGSGPCFFCGELVCSPNQQIILQRNTKQANNLYVKLMDQKPNKEFEESVERRDKLLEHDRNSERRMKVIDDESDYYQSNSIWLSNAERDILRKQETEANARKHASRLENKRVTIDIMGRAVIDEDEYSKQCTNAYAKKLTETIYNELENLNVCPTIEFDRPTFIEMGSSRTRKSTNHIWNTESRIQDKEYLEMFDQGLCLSIQQPYASLLIAGIKTHEGRTWYSSHRGRLWIASAAKIPSVEEISVLKHSYHILKSEKLKFPETYPTGCLLGCVTITDVLPQSEYRKLYPEGECDSPYVFICENCYELPIHFPIQGKNKIYRLDQKLHQAAINCLEKAMKIAKH